MAATLSPTLRVELEANSAAARPVASIFITAISLDTSKPMSFASCSLPSYKTTVAESPLSRTWVFVIIYPSAEAITPLPQAY